MKNEAEHRRLSEAKWDRWAESVESNNWRHRFLRRAQDRVISLLDTREGVNFLDIGCGTGWAIAHFAELIDYNGSFYGVDLSWKMIEKAKERFKSRSNFFFVKANAESIPLVDNFFDMIICTNSFHHYFNPIKALTEMHRLLKTRGRVYILDPTADNWLVKLIDKLGEWFEPEHVKLYSTEEFRSLFSVAGLKYVATEVINNREKIHVGEK